MAKDGLVVSTVTARRSGGGLPSSVQWLDAAFSDSRLTLGMSVCLYASAAISLYPASGLKAAGKSYTPLHTPPPQK